MTLFKKGSPPIRSAILRKNYKLIAIYTILYIIIDKIYDILSVVISEDVMSKITSTSPSVELTTPTASNEATHAYKEAATKVLGNQFSSPSTSAADLMLLGEGATAPLSTKMDVSKPLPPTLSAKELAGTPPPGAKVDQSHRFVGASGHSPVKAFITRNSGKIDLNDGAGKPAGNITLYYETRENTGQSTTTTGKPIKVDNSQETYGLSVTKPIAGSNVRLFGSLVHEEGTNHTKKGPNTNTFDALRMGVGYEQKLNDRTNVDATVSGALVRTDKPRAGTDAELTLRPRVTLKATHDLVKDKNFGTLGINAGYIGEMRIGANEAAHKGLANGNPSYVSGVTAGLNYKNAKDTFSMSVGLTHTLTGGARSGDPTGWTGDISTEKGATTIGGKLNWRF
jgi:hypothetical protein